MRFTKPVKQIAVTFCDTQLHVKEWTAALREEFETNVAKMTGKLRAYIVSLSLVDADGNRVVEDLDELNQLPYSEINTVVEIASSLNQLNKTAIDDLEKN